MTIKTGRKAKSLEETYSELMTEIGGLELKICKVSVEISLLKLLALSFPEEYREKVLGAISKMEKIFKE